MPVVEWSDIYLVGLPDLDEDHKRFVAAIAEICAAAESDPPEDAAGLLKRLDTLIEAFARHGVKEERMLSLLRSPAGMEHRRQHVAGHSRFREEVGKVRSHIADGGPAPGAVGELGVFLMLFELIRSDYDMVGLLRQEGLLVGDGRLVEGASRQDFEP